MTQSGHRHFTYCDAFASACRPRSVIMYSVFRSLCRCFITYCASTRRMSPTIEAAALTIRPRSPAHVRFRNSSEFVFGERGFNVFGRAKQELDQRLHIAPWRLHDLRRTAATGMAELGIQPWYVEAVLNHQSGHKQGVAGTYNRAKYADDMRDALQRWADHIDGITR